MAVDQRALLLKSGNDLSTNIVFDELEKYAKHENGLTIIHTKYSAKFEVSIIYNIVCKHLFMIYFHQYF